MSVTITKKLISLLLCFVIISGICMPVKAEEDIPSQEQDQTTEQNTGQNEDENGATPEPEPEPGGSGQEQEPDPVPVDDKEPEPQEPPVLDPVRMSVSDTPQVKAGENVDFVVKFTAEEGYVIDSVEMVTSTDINTFPFGIDLSNYKVFYGTAEAEYPFELTARAGSAGGYYKIPVNVNYIGPGGGSSVQFLIPVYVTAEKKEEKPPEKEPEVRPLPKMIVYAVSTDPAEVEPGREFVLSITVENTSGSDSVKNMEVTVTPQGGAFSSASGTTSAYISYLGADCTYTISMCMIPKDGLAPGVYNLDVKMAYDTSMNNASSSASETITVKVSQAPQARAAAIDANPYGGAYVGESISLRSAVYNVGKMPIYNVFATFSSKDGIISSKEVFLGNIEAGGTGEISTYVSALNVGTTTIQMNVRYEDGSGKTYTLESEIPYGITEKQKNSSDILPEPEDDKGNVLKWVSLGVVAAAAAAGGLVLYRRRKGSETEDIEE